MLKLKRIALEDRGWITSLIKCEDSRSADASFGAMFLWNNEGPRFVAKSGGRLVFMRTEKETPLFLCPFGSGSLVPVVSELKEYCSNTLKKPLVLVGVLEKYLQEIKETFRDEFTFRHERSYDDYIYSAEKLLTLSGKALHGKRNHINNFESNYPDWSFVPLEKTQIPLCLEIMEKWEQIHGEHRSDAENEAIRFAFRNFDTLNMPGGILFANGTPAAFTFGERLCKDTFVVHFEKALTNINGAYAMINREFVRYITELFPEIKYINREEDMDIENLRKAKESYEPDFMVKKYTLVWEQQK